VSTGTSHFESVMMQALKLSRGERAKLVERLAATLYDEQERRPRKNSYGILADMGIDVSIEHIREIRREMMKNFPREDLI
jgi:hypothetical protein